MDYTHIRWAPVINCLIMHHGRILLVQRSQGMRLYPGLWNGISGFLDDDQSFDEKVHEELAEEVGITKENILSLKRGVIFHINDPALAKTWIVHPVLVTVSTHAFHLDREAQAGRWMTWDEAATVAAVPGFDRVLAACRRLADA